MNEIYRGRLAPSPTGYLHLGHARTFWVAHRRARAAAGKLVFRNEDLDQQRSRQPFVTAMYEDLRWLGLNWDEGPDVGGPFAPYTQSERRAVYLATWRTLRDTGLIYQCTCSRKDLECALSAPHESIDPGTPALGDDEVHYPGTCRQRRAEAQEHESPAGVSWRFCVPEGQAVGFDDGYYGPQQFVAGRDFGDFLIWRRDDVPAYQLAVIADDQEMQITEVVRGADLLLSTARQLLIIRALSYRPPRYFHCPLVTDQSNQRLAKRHDALSLRTLRQSGMHPAELRGQFEREIEWARDLDRT